MRTASNTLSDFSAFTCNSDDTFNSNRSQRSSGTREKQIIGHRAIFKIIVTVFLIVQEQLLHVGTLCNIAFLAAFAKDTKAFFVCIGLHEIAQFGTTDTCIKQQCKNGFVANIQVFFLWIGVQHSLYFGRRKGFDNDFFFFRSADFIHGIDGNVFLGLQILKPCTERLVQTVDITRFSACTLQVGQKMLDMRC